MLFNEIEVSGLEGEQDKKSLGFRGELEEGLVGSGRPAWVSAAARRLEARESWRKRSSSAGDTELL